MNSNQMCRNRRPFIETMDKFKESEARNVKNYEISVEDCPQALQDAIQHLLDRECKLLCVNRSVCDNDVFAIRAYAEDDYGILIILHYSVNGEIFKCFITSLDLQTFYQHSHNFKETVKLLGGNEKDFERK